MLTVVDQYSRQSPLIEAIFTHSGHSVSAALTAWSIDSVYTTALNSCSKHARNGRGDAV